MPLLEHPVAGALRGHRQPVELPGETHREVGDVDHLLDLALALGDDLAHFQGDQGAEGLLVLPEGVADEPDVLSPLWGRQHPPAVEHVLG